MRMITCSDAGLRLHEMIEHANDEQDVTYITRGGAPGAVLVSWEHYSGLIEIVRRLASPATIAQLDGAMAQALTALLLQCQADLAHAPSV